jgi:argininosuccinate lyase
LDINAYQKLIEQFLNLLTTRASIQNKKSIGSTSPQKVEKQINHWEKILK